MSRRAYVALALGTIGLGLIVHSYGSALGPTSRDVAGDVLWAAMIAWLIGAVTPRTDLWKRAIAAVMICWCVEFSQLYHTPSLDTLRDSTVGQLTLGTGFDPRDLFAYLAGVLIAAVIERATRTAAGHSPGPKKV